MYIECIKNIDKFNVKQGDVFCKIETKVYLLNLGWDFLEIKEFLDEYFKEFTEATYWTRSKLEDYIKQKTPKNNSIEDIYKIVNSSTPFPKYMQKGLFYDTDINKGVVDDLGAFFDGVYLAFSR